MRAWLVVLYLMILCMVCIGGITRLTGSGLSMVEWHPLMGAVPPLTEADWVAVFEKYKEFPQYQQVNQWMQLDDFKRIFFWEYLHRLWGRLIGVVAFVPWLFLVRGMDGGMRLRTAGLIVLGGLQGLLGWYMVKSGLIHEPAVSHFRLAAHLSLAFVVALFALWLFLDVVEPGRRTERSIAAGLGVLGLFAAQTVYGAFMAGKRAGLLAATWPSMNGHWSPAGLIGSDGVVHDLFYGGLMIHWVHRWFAVVVALAVLGLAWMWRQGPTRTPAIVAVVLVGVQFVLGVLTVMWFVPIAVAVAHQANALLLGSSLLWLIHRRRYG